MSSINFQNLFKFDSVSDEITFGNASNPMSITSDLGPITFVDTYAGSDGKPRVTVHTDDDLTSFTGTSLGGFVLRNSDYQSGDYNALDFSYNDFTKPIARIAAKISGSGTELHFGTSNNYASGITNTALRIDDQGDARFYNNLTVSGNLTINGTTTTLNTATLDVEDLNITVAKGAANASAANGAGLTVDGAGASLNYYATPNAWSFNKKVGIGTTSPLYSLSVEKVISGSNAYISITSHAGDNAALLLGDPDNKSIGRVTYYNATNAMGLRTNGADRITIDSAGNVGIGTDNPSAKLEIQNGADGVGDADLAFTDMGGVRYTMGIKDGSQAFQIAEGSTLSPSTPTAISATRFLIDTDGNVGIGTDQPNAPLNVSTESTLQYSGSLQTVNTSLVLTNSLAGDGASQNVGLAFHLKTPSNGFGRYSWIGSVQDQANARYSSLVFGTDEGTSAQPNRLEKMRITHDGKVGIGTDQPSSKLHIEGSNPSIKVKADADGEDSHLMLHDHEGNGWTIYNEGGNTGGAGVDSLLFRDDTNNATAMTIRAGGNVGIGTADLPSHRLNVSDGTVNFKINPITDHATAGTEAQIGTVTNHDLTIQTNNTTRMTIESDGTVKIGTHTAGVANSKNADGFVSAPGNVANKVWKTDGSGNPAWRDDAAGTTSANYYLDGITKNGNTLTFSVSGGTSYDQTFTFGSNAFNSTTIPTNNNQLTNGKGYTTNTGTTTASNTQTFTNKSGNISQWSNDSGYKTTDTWKLNTATVEGYVSAPGTNNADKVWKTDANGVPGWGVISAGTSQDTTFKIRGDAVATIQTIAHDNTLKLLGGTGIDTVCTWEDTLTVSVNAGEIPAGDLDFSEASLAIGTTTGNGSDAILMVHGKNNDGQSIIADGDVVAMNNASDDRLKTNTNKIDNALDKVASLEGFSFDWNDAAKEVGITGEEQVGLSAQSLEKVLPQVVKALPDSDYKMVDYQKIVPLLVEAIKELKSEIEELKGKQDPYKY